VRGMAWAGRFVAPRTLRLRPQRLPALAKFHRSTALTFSAGTSRRMADGSQWNKQDDATMMSAILNIIGLSQQEGVWRTPIDFSALRAEPPAAEPRARVPV
jgi:hypothetical protein